MTSEELAKTLELIHRYGKGAAKVYTKEVMDHDAKQCAEIEAKDAEIARLKRHFVPRNMFAIRDTFYNK